MFCEDGDGRRRCDERRHGVDDVGVDTGQATAAGQAAATADEEASNGSTAGRATGAED